MRYFNPETREESRRRSFDLEQDPREILDLGSDFGRAGALRDQAATTNGIEYQSRLEEIPEDVLDALKALGYGGDGG